MVVLRAQKRSCGQPQPRGHLWLANCQHRTSIAQQRGTTAAKVAGTLRMQSADAPPTVRCLMAKKAAAFVAISENTPSPLWGEGWGEGRFRPGAARLRHAERACYVGPAASQCGRPARAESLL